MTPCPGRVTVREHAEVRRIAHDHARFSNAVSRFLQVPNGLDGPEHAAARRLLDPFLSRDRVDELEPVFDGVARELVDRLSAKQRTFDAVADLGARYAVRAQSRWLGWRADLEEVLLHWVGENREATRSGELEETHRVAQNFDEIIDGLLAERRDRPHRDVTSELMELRHEDGRRFSDEEIISVLRNWTGGDLASIALCTGVVVHWLASHPERQRELLAAPGAELDAAIDEMLRLDDPFVSNRRRAVGDSVVAGCPIGAGSTVVLDWRAANRDPRVFGEPDRFDPEKNRAHNLVYGTGVHVCPGRELATRELRVLTRRVLASGTIVFDEDHPAERERPPFAGYRTVPVRIVPRAQ